MKLDYKKEAKFFATVALGAGVFAAGVFGLGNVNNIDAVWRAGARVVNEIQQEEVQPTYHQPVVNPDCLIVEGLEIGREDCNVRSDNGRYHITGSDTWSVNTNNNTAWRNGERCNGHVMMYDYEEISRGRVKEIGVACTDYDNGSWAITFPSH